MPTVQKINVTVEEVIYPRLNEESSFFVLVTDKGKISGNMSWRPESGERLTVEGAWGAYRGQRTFRFNCATCNVPTSPYDKLVYVCERASGVGHAMQERIWETWGEDWEEKHNADTIPRFNKHVFESFTETLSDVNQDADKANAISWLMSKGGTMALAASAWEEWEKETIGIVNSNCYRLADLPGFGFQNVDKSIRYQFGIEDSDPRRIEAGVVYALKQLTSAGSTVTTWIELRTHTVKLLGGMYQDMICEIVTKMFQDGTLRGFKESQTIALGSDFFNERDIWTYCNNALNGGGSAIKQKPERIISND